MDGPGGGPEDRESGGDKTVVIFRIGTEWLALPTGIFQEVVDQCVVRTLPHRRGGILRGLVNVRGELLLCVALGAVLGLEKDTQRNDKATAQGRLLTATGTPTGWRFGRTRSTVCNAITPAT